MVKVYEEIGDEDIIADVESNNNLDFWDGRNWTCGSTGLHKGLTKLKDGRLVLIHGTQWQGQDDYGVIISKRNAIQEIINSGDKDLLDEFDLRDIYEKEFKQETGTKFCFRGSYQVIKVGNSLGIRLESTQLKNAEIKEGYMIDVSIYRK